MDPKKYLTVGAVEQQRFVDAIVQLNNHRYPGSRTDFSTGGVSQWFKMDEIHQATHVHAVNPLSPLLLQH